MPDEPTLQHNAARTLKNMKPDARKRHIADMKRLIGEEATEAKLAEWRQILQQSSQ